MDLLATITGLSHEFGTADYVKGGGGNTSAKNADTLWVKPSGTTLAKLTPKSFVALDRRGLATLYTATMPAETAAREERVKDLLAAAVRPGSKGRASVEAPLHDILAGVFVVHTHPIVVNGLTCARDGTQVCARLFPEALWVPYVDPGFTLCMDVRRRVQDFQRQHGRPPMVIILENHGIFVTGNTAAEVRGYYQHVTETLRADYRRRGVSLSLPIMPAPSAAVVEQTTRELRELLGEAATGVASCEPFAVPRGPLTPDHIVYAKSFVYRGPLTSEGLAGYQRAWRAMPRVIATDSGVFGVGQTQTQAQLALDMAQDGALVQQLADAFGGIQFLSDRAREFIENWEVEVYRQKQLE